MRNSNSMTTAEMADVAILMDNINTAMTGRVINIEPITIRAENNDLLGYISINGNEVNFFPDMDNE